MNHHHHISTGERNSEAKKVTIIGSIFDFLLGVGKILAGFFYNSHALIIDGIHSFTDVFTDIFVVAISHYSNQEPDEEHPYGHEKFETLGTVAMGAILLATAGALLYETIERLFAVKEAVIPGKPALAMAFLSILVKEFLYHYTRRVGEKINSSLLIANAWHSRTDAISSIVVLGGIILSYFGYSYFDDIAAIIVAIFIGKIGWDFLTDSLGELAESSIDSDKVDEIEKSILKIDGVKGCHNLRTRKMGHKTLIDVNIEVDEFITVSEGHEISSWVAKFLTDNYQDVTDVTVHTDVEDDMDDNYQHTFTGLLPLRSGVISMLETCWKDLPVFEDAPFIKLHYIGRRINVDLLYRCQPQVKEEILNEKVKQVEWLGEVKIWTSYEDQPAP
ncbi:MAG: cation transporter [Oligoflexia bacterium]|nr:cation transporter [Oligoflexia bacterium]